ncbi:hypothetical protein O7622_05650 [Micromonospora sp. WMMD1076]|uniref:hypothetical protein n=1 Tax=Micromonospora sp. WMMD1076 TaxID=3016103 RepID=UPI002499C4AE|nr:hypothetical protein [Micromonospora sp. WMMD1076]WFF08057.1 hypothetical protein O7622_05650 [Micromonospora sp. WMMD1076]
MVKDVDNPYGGPAPEPTAWTLSAYPQGSTERSISGTTGVTGEVTPDVSYSLGETAVAGFV